MSSQGFPAVSEMLGDEREHRREMARKINNINGGKVNCTLDVVVTAGATSTPIVDVRISPFCLLSTMAIDANGAADEVAGIYWTNLNNGSATMNHRNNGSTRTLRVLILG